MGLVKAVTKLLIYSLRLLIMLEEIDKMLPSENIICRQSNFTQIYLFNLHNTLPLKDHKYVLNPHFRIIHNLFFPQFKQLTPINNQPQISIRQLAE